MNVSRIEGWLKILNRQIEKVKTVFTNNNKNFFFNEHEIHSYLYHLCAQKKIFKLKNGLNCIHAEYPTPFKCNMGNRHQDMKIESDDSNFRRGHIDIVLLNPHFIEWIFKESTLYEPIDYIRGIAEDKFSIYISEMRNKYERFYKEKKEPVILSAIEFKFFRTHGGLSNPINLIVRDLKKLDGMKEIKINELKSIPFSKERRSIVFINQNAQLLIEGIKNDKEIQFMKGLLEIIQF